MTTTTTTRPTDRERFYTAPPTVRIGLIFEHLFNERGDDALRDGLANFAQRYFAEFTDATDLPSEFWAFVQLAEDPLLGPGMDVGEFTEEDR